jgi:methylated-DNA-[protein]-cysteine S-methyltransferase
MSENPALYSVIDSPVGPLTVAMRDGALVSLSYGFTGRPTAPKPEWKRDDAALLPWATQIDEWFAGSRTGFDIPLSYGGDAFQRSVWEAMLQIPFGETRTYGDIARLIGAGPQASRAVGVACGDNPIPLVIPCHRVVGAGGALTGFAHGAEGGLAAKRFLLEHEFRLRPPADTLFGHAAGV